MGPVVYILFACCCAMLAYARQNHVAVETWQWGAVALFGLASVREFVAARARKKPQAYHDLKVKPEGQ